MALKFSCHDEWWPVLQVSDHQAFGSQQVDFTLAELAQIKAAQDALQAAQALIAAKFAVSNHSPSDFCLLVND